MRRDLIVGTLSVICCIITVTPRAILAQTQGWQTSAKWRRTLKKSELGILVFDAEGVEFRSPKWNWRWQYVDIHTFDLSQRQLKLLTYENRPWREPGERPFRFRLSEPMPPEVAAQLADRVGKPVRNGVPPARPRRSKKFPPITVFGLVAAMERFA